MLGLQLDERLAANPDNHPLVLNNDSLILFDKRKKKKIQGSAAQSCCALTRRACVCMCVHMCSLLMMCMAREMKSASGSAMSVVSIDRQSSFCRIGLCLVFHCDSILETSVQQRRQRDYVLLGMGHYKTG